MGNVRRSHIYSRYKFAAGGSEKLKCLQGARNSRKVVIHQTVSRWRRLGEQCGSHWNWERISGGFGPS